MPTVSVSIITYNQAPFIARAIESVLAQETDFPVEIHIGDDCSTDGTQEILKRYRDRFPKQITLHLHETKGEGVPGRVNNVTNLRACQGDFVAMLDGDDYWCDPGKLQRQVSLLRARPELSAVAHDCALFNERENRIEPTTLYQRLAGAVPSAGRDITARELLTPLVFHVSSFCFRRRCLEAFPDWFMEVPAADAALILLLGTKGPIHFETSVSSVYRIHDGGVFGQLSREERTRFSLDSWAYFLAHVPEARSRRSSSASVTTGA